MRRHCPWNRRVPCLVPPSVSGSVPGPPARRRYGTRSCGCTEAGCAFGADDGVNDFIAKAREADGFVFGTPVYYAHPSGRILSFLDRVFYSGSGAFAFKPGAAVAVARRGGTSASFDVLNKYFGISRMPVANRRARRDDW